jgi:predicted transcriptional regulator
MLLAGAVMDALLGLGDCKKVGWRTRAGVGRALFTPLLATINPGTSLGGDALRRNRRQGDWPVGRSVTVKDEANSMATSYGETETNDDDVDILGLSAGIVAAYVAQNTVARSAVPDLIRSVHSALASLGESEPERTAERNKPAVPISRSVQRDHIVCLEDGKKLKMLKRYLRTHYDMSPEEYRRKWSLPGDYPMVAPAYAERRSDFAKSIGLGKGKMRGR